MTQEKIYIKFYYPYLNHRENGLYPYDKNLITVESLIANKRAGYRLFTRIEMEKDNIVLRSDPVIASGWHYIGVETTNGELDKPISHLEKDVRICQLAKGWGVAELDEDDIVIHSDIKPDKKPPEFKPRFNPWTKEYQKAGNMKKPKNLK